MEHITHLISDYVLDLLPMREKERVEQHAAACPHCRQLLQAERHLAHLTRETFALATAPSPARIAALMPPVPARPRPWHSTPAWQRSLALAGVCLFLIITSFGLYPGGQNTSWAASPAAATHVAATATATAIPATATHTLTASPTNTSAPEFVPTTFVPGAAATPVAFLSVGSNQSSVVSP